MKINILVDNDKCWNLNIVKRLIPYLKKNKIIIDHIWILPNKLGNLGNNKISIWYFKTFGTIVFLKLSFFYILTLTFNFIYRINNFRDLAKKYNIKYKFIYSTDDKHLLKNINKNKKKFSLLITNHILKKKILNKQNHFFINKHSSLLPSCKGLMPYLWAKIINIDNGITFHLVNRKIDSGKIIYQKKIKKKFQSMIGFYLHIFAIFPNAFLQAIRNLEKKRFIKSKNKKSYYSLPNKKDYGNFLKKNGNIILMSDFFKINKLI